MFNYFAYWDKVFVVYTCCCCVSALNRKRMRNILARSVETFGTTINHKLTSVPATTRTTTALLRLLAVRWYCKVIDPICVCRCFMLLICVYLLGYVHMYVVSDCVSNCSWTVSITCTRIMFYDCVCWILKDFYTQQKIKNYKKIKKTKTSLKILLWRS